MPHYTCIGDCKGISMQPGSCKAKECDKHDQPLTECNCTDGKHRELEEGYEEPAKEQANLLNENEGEEMKDGEYET